MDHYRNSRKEQLKRTEKLETEPIIQSDIVPVPDCKDYFAL